MSVKLDDGELLGVTSVNVSMKANDLPRVTLELIVSDITREEADVET